MSKSLVRKERMMCRNKEILSRTQHARMWGRSNSVRKQSLLEWVQTPQASSASLLFGEGVGLQNRELRPNQAVVRLCYIFHLFDVHLALCRLLDPQQFSTIRNCQL